MLTGELKKRLFREFDVEDEENLVNSIVRPARKNMTW